MLCRVDWCIGSKDPGAFFLRAKQSTIKQLDPKAKGKMIHRKFRNYLPDDTP
jgi:hypothetical protein